MGVGGAVTVGVAALVVVFVVELKGEEEERGAEDVESVAERC